MSQYDWQSKVHERYNDDFMWYLSCPLTCEIIVLSYLFSLEVWGKILYGFYDGDWDVSEGYADLSDLKVSEEKKSE